MGTAVEGVVWGCGRPAAAGGRVSWAQSAAVCLLGDLWVPCHATIKKSGLLGGPRLGLPDAARSRDFKFTRKALLPRFCTADCGNGLWRARGVGLGWEQLRGGGGVRRRIPAGPGDLMGGILVKIRGLS